jgi:hypothetical protein
LVTVRIIEPLEVVDVDEDHRQRTALTLRSASFPKQRVVEDAAIRDAGEAIDGREEVQPGVGSLEHLLRLLQLLEHALTGPLQQEAARVRPHPRHELDRVWELDEVVGGAFGERSALVLRLLVR